LGFLLAEKDTEQGKKGGLRLTSQGKALLDQYKNIHQSVESLVGELERKFF
jgi:molybdenum-dependent DNA-binding transcriptional regulator ModE